MNVYSAPNSIQPRSLLTEALKPSGHQAVQKAEGGIKKSLLSEQLAKLATESEFGGHQPTFNLPPMMQQKQEAESSHTEFVVGGPPEESLLEEG